MRKYLTRFASVLLLTSLLLAGCSNDSKPAETTAANETAETMEAVEAAEAEDMVDETEIDEIDETEELVTE